MTVRIRIDRKGISITVIVHGDSVPSTSPIPVPRKVPPNPITKWDVAKVVFEVLGILAAILVAILAAFALTK